jgi:hypothetical protein
MLDKITNIVYDTDYTTVVNDGGFPVISQSQIITKTSTTPPTTTVSQPSNGVRNQILQLFGLGSTTTKSSNSTQTQEAIGTDVQVLANKNLQDQIKHILQLPDEQYSDNLLTSALRRHILQIEQEYQSTVNDYKSHIAPSYREIKPSTINLSGIIGKTYYAQSYPSYIDMLWTRDMLSFHGKWDMSFFVFPEDDGDMQAMLKTRATQLKAQINDANARGITIDTEIEVQYKDVENIRQKLATREERYFET